MSSGTTYTVKVGKDEAGKRLDRVLADALPALSRTRIRSLMEEGRVTDAASRAATNPASKAKMGEVFTVVEPPPTPAR